MVHINTRVVVGAGAVVGNRTNYTRLWSLVIKIVEV